MDGNRIDDAVNAGIKGVAFDLGGEMHGSKVQQGSPEVKTLRPLTPQPTRGKHEGWSRVESRHQRKHGDSPQREPTVAVEPCFSVVSRRAGQIPGPNDMGTWPIELVYT